MVQAIKFWHHVQFEIWICMGVETTGSSDHFFFFLEQLSYAAKNVYQISLHFQTDRYQIWQWLKCSDKTN